MSENLKKLKFEISDNRLTSDKVRLKGLVDDFIKNDNECHDDCYDIVILTIEFGFLKEYLLKIQNPSTYTEILRKQNYSNNEIKRILVHCEYLSGNCTYEKLISTVFESNSTKKKSQFNFLKSKKVKISFVKVSSFDIMIGDEVVVEWGIINYKKITLIIDNQNKIDVTNDTSYKFSPTKNISFYLLIENANFIQKEKTKVLYVRVFNKICLTFNPKRKFSIQGLPVKLSWISKNAKDISIHSNIGDSFTNLKEKGNIEVYPSKDCIYTIIATHALERIEKKVYLFIKEIPTVTNLKIPNIPKFTPDFSIISNYQLESDTSLNPNTKNATSIEKVIKSHSNMFDLILNSTDSTKIIEHINTLIYDKKDT